MTSRLVEQDSSSWTPARLTPQFALHLSSVLPALMRLFHVFVVMVAAVLATSEALAIADPTQASVSKATTSGGTDQRLLRARPDDPEERGLNQFHYDRLNSFGKKLGINVEKALNKPGYLIKLARERPEALKQYQDKLNALIKANKKKRPPVTD